MHASSLPSRACAALLGAVATVLLVLLPLGCPPCEPGVTELLLADFEDCEPPCGWSIEQGSVERVQTVHSSQHALLLSDDAVLSHPLGGEVGARQPAEILLTSDCGSNLTLTLTIRDVGGGAAAEQEVELVPCDPERDRDVPIIMMCVTLDEASLGSAELFALEFLRIATRRACLIDGVYVFIPEPDACG